MTYKSTEPTITSKFPIEVPTHEYYSNYAVYKVWFGSRFFIWKGKSFAQSAEALSVSIDRAKRLHSSDDTNILYQVVGHINRNRVVKATLEIISIADFDDADWVKYLQCEQNILTAHINNPLCLNINTIAHVPAWMGTDVHNKFNEWLNERNKPNKSTKKKKDARI